MQYEEFLVLSDGYHGHDDDFVSLTDPALGVPTRAWMRKLEKDFTYEQIDSADAVIIEPIITDASDERIAWLRKLKDFCNRSGTVLIFDEVISGFRFPKYSASSYYGIEPDLVCVGKAMANGFPLSAVAGKDKIMNCGEYFISSTFAGCMDALAAFMKVSDLLHRKFSLEALWEGGASFIKSFNAMAPDKISILGYPSRGVFAGDAEFRAMFFQEACFAGILFGPSFFYSFPLMQEAPLILGTLKDIVGRISRGEVKLVGQMPQSPFAQRVREQ